MSKWRDGLAPSKSLGGSLISSRTVFTRRTAFLRTQADNAGVEEREGAKTRRPAPMASPGMLHACCRIYFIFFGQFAEVAMNFQTIRKLMSIKPFTELRQRSNDNI